MALSGEIHFRLSLHRLRSDDSPVREKCGSGCKTAIDLRGADGASGESRNAKDISDISSSTLNAVSSTSTDFRSFLDTDVDFAVQKELFMQQLQSLRDLKRINRIKNEHEHSYIHKQLTASLALAVREQLHRANEIYQVGL